MLSEIYRDKALNEILRQVDDHVVLVLSAAFIDCYGQLPTADLSRVPHSNRILPPKIFHDQRGNIVSPLLNGLSLIAIYT